MTQRRLRKGPSVVENVPWLDLTGIAQVEVSSENPSNPIDDALVPGINRGWISTLSGPQTVRLVFHEPRKLAKLRLVFKEDNHQRTQEFAVSWSEDNINFKELLRQQYNFNPPSVEIEEYEIKLENAIALELQINPSINACGTATLAELRLA
jgi:hypothetical protein